MRIFSHRHREPWLGDFPLERLSRNADTAIPDRLRPLESQRFVDAKRPHSLANAMDAFMAQIDRMRDGPSASKPAPVPSDPVERSRHLKAACFFLNASMAGVCRIPAQARLDARPQHPALDAAAGGSAAGGSAGGGPPGGGPPGGGPPGGGQPPENIALMGAQMGAAMRAGSLPAADDHPWAIAILAEYPRDPDPEEPGGDWLSGTQAQRAAVRSGEVAVVIAQYLRMLGYRARAHSMSTSDLHPDPVIIASGLGLADESGLPRNPFIGNRYGWAIVSTDFELAPDQALSADTNGRARDFRWWLGMGGTRPGLSGEPYRNRPFHLGPYPMESVRRVPQPTTGIDADNVPRIPKRHDMFMRASKGDLGAKARREMDFARCVTKHPFANAMTPLMGSMVGLQRGETAAQVAAGHDDPEANAGRVKAALYYLGADMVGISEAPDYVWYSHGNDGRRIEPYHKYAVSVLIDQGYETMEGASGDDWISGAQSVRAYLRTNLLCSIVAAQIRAMGYSARAHSTLDQDVLHIPCLLLSGLGELSRIGELVLNPFVGPRFKSGVITTDMPMDVDRPIDFGLQDFCSQCRKCARECPCSAIPFGDKIVFNGYEMWKPDVEKCARYRITNAAGALCGRCMKTCPFNLEGVLAERPFLWAAMNLPSTRKWLADLDDKIGNGRINPIKKWWWDLDIDGDGQVIPARRTNERQLNFRPPLRPEDQKLAMYPASSLPPPDADGPVPVDRKAGVGAYQAAARSFSRR